MKKKNLRIMSKQYAHLHARAKTSLKFQNDWPKTVGGVALTSQLLTNGQMDEKTGHGRPISHKLIRILQQNLQNWLLFQILYTF